MTSVENIYYHIKNNDGTQTFLDIYKKFRKTLSKYEIGNYLRTLEADGQILSFNDVYYEFKKKPTISGYSQWNLLGSCWFSTEDSSDSYGITYTTDKVINIINKKDCPHVSKVSGKIITTDVGEYFYLIENKTFKKINIIANYSGGYWYSIVNNNLKFKSEDRKFQNGDISLFTLYRKLSHKKELGNIKDNAIESSMIRKMCELKYAPNVNIETKTVLNEFLDLPFYTIDNITTKDIDDAIYIEKNDIGYKLYVAIADVSSYIDKDSELDKHSENECTSFYLPSKTIHMLHKNISEKFCSLKVGEKRSTMICEVQYDINNIQIDSKFYVKDIISNYRLTYNDVNKILLNEIPTESFYYDSIGIKTLNHIPDNLKTSLNVLKDYTDMKMLENATNNLNIKKAEFKLNEFGKIGELYYKTEYDAAQKMVEIAMISANKIAAKFLYDYYPSLGIFRNQNQPVDIKNPKAAFYDFNNSGHWGLNIEYYTHFTSPIRRYCDLIVHRLIKDIINNTEKYPIEQLEKISNRINKQHLKAKMIRNKCFNLLESQYIDELIKKDVFKTEFKLVEILEKGIVIVNEQLIETYIPLYKVDKEFLADINNNINWTISCDYSSYVWFKEVRSLKFNFTKNEC